MTTTKHGWEKITKVVPQVDFDLDGLGTFAILWLETKHDIFAVDVRHGETIKGLADRYRKRGCTDDRCTWFRAR
jgi:hypothetical protein